MSFAFLNMLAQDKLPFKSVGVSEFARAVADTSYVVLDVRTAEEYAEAHIPGTDFNIDVLEERTVSNSNYCIAVRAFFGNNDISILVFAGADQNTGTVSV